MAVTLPVYAEKTLLAAFIKEQLLYVHSAPLAWDADYEFQENIDGGN